MKYQIVFQVLSFYIFCLLLLYYYYKSTTIGSFLFIVSKQITVFVLLPKDTVAPVVAFVESVNSVFLKMVDIDYPNR